MERSKTYAEHSSSTSSYMKVHYGIDDLPKSYSFNGPSSRGEEFGAAGDRETKRRKRVAFYDRYTMEGKVKLSLQKSFKWIKTKVRGGDYFEA
ncbi:hypothetical protein AKJ16_DCAP22207 [Drosera capensis]